MSGGDNLRLGIVGTGAVAQLVHLPLLANRNDVELVAVADKDPDKAGALAERFDVPRVLATDALLQDDEVDALVLCTPNHLHEAEAVAALESGKHVLVERPLALTPEGCSQVMRAAKAAERTIMVGQHHRFRPDVAALRAFVASGELGRVYGARVVWMNRYVPLRRTTWRQLPGEAGGGALVDLGVQALDLLLWLLGDVRVAKVTATLTREEDAVEDAANLLMETSDGIALTLEVSWKYFSYEDKHYARIMGSEGSGRLPPLEIFRQLGGRPMEVTPGQGQPQGGSRYLNAHRRQLDHFLRAVRGFADVPEPEQQQHVMEIIHAAYRSAEEGRGVEL